MPSCKRFAAVMIVFGFAGYVVLFALAALVEPHPRAIVTNVAVRPDAAEMAPSRERSAKPAGETVSFYQSLQALPLNGR
jgi:hypothetical protein